MSIKTTYLHSLPSNILTQACWMLMHLTLSLLYCLLQVVPRMTLSTSKYTPLLNILFFILSKCSNHLSNPSLTRNYTLRDPTPFLISTVQTLCIKQKLELFKIREAETQCKIRYKQNFKTELKLMHRHVRKMMPKNLVMRFEEGAGTIREIVYGSH